MSRFTFWSVNRDRECSPPNNGYTSSECSSVTQNPWDFTAYTVAFAKNNVGHVDADPDAHSDHVVTHADPDSNADIQFGWLHRSGLGLE